MYARLAGVMMIAFVALMGGNLLQAKNRPYICAEGDNMMLRCERK